MLLFSSCAKLSYITEQGIGQISLEWNGKANREILNDKTISDVHKEKIKRIEAYKKYFYEYFNKKQTDIYDETTFLQDEAVTYLVIVSPKDEIKALETSFPIVGSFPYLGFFKKKSALEYKNLKEKEGFATFMRPVYAYSTLNQWIFDDNILSSFFYYSDYELAELIFHELTHTILFIKDEVDFNESLAEVMGSNLAKEYFKKSEDEVLSEKEEQKKNEILRSSISKLGNKLNTQYKTSLDYTKTLEDFLSIEFLPKIKEICVQYQIDRCWPLKGKWNNAKFASFLTYNKDQNLIEDIKNQKKLNLKELLSYIEKKYKKYKNEDTDKDFSQYLRSKE